MNGYAKGANRERQLLQVLRNDGWYAERTAGSHGVADCVALKDGKRPRLIQVKSDTKGPFANFGPDAREDLLLAADLAGAQAWLLWWPARSEPIWIGPEDWPE